MEIRFGILTGVDKTKYKNNILEHQIFNVVLSVNVLLVDGPHYDNNSILHLVIYVFRMFVDVCAIDQTASLHAV